MISFRSWPDRALETVFDTIRHTIMDAMVDMEQGDQRPVAIRMSRPMMEVWDAYWSSRERYAMHASAERSMMWGMSIGVDRSLDRSFTERERRPGDGLVVGDMRIMTNGHGSVPIEFRAYANPESLRYEIEVGVRGPHNPRRRRISFSFSSIRGGGMEVQQRARPMAPTENVTMGEYQARQQPTIPKREMSDLMIAWNT